MRTVKSVAIVGMTCNPLHLDHLKFLDLVLEQHFDLVLFYVSGYSSKAGLINGWARSTLAQVGIPRDYLTRLHQGRTALFLDTSGVMVPDVYAIDRIEQVKAAFPGAEVVTVLGSDWFTPLPNGVVPFMTWTGIEKLLKERVMIVNRGGYTDRDVVGLPSTFWWLGNTPTTGYSGVEIRDLVKTQQHLLSIAQTWREMVSEEVADVIDMHGLYLK